jgi:hypothetical protein
LRASAALFYTRTVHTGAAITSREEVTTGQIFQKDIVDAFADCSFS